MSEEARRIADRMAAREARLLLRRSQPAVALAVRPLTCPHCGTGATGFEDRLGELRFRDVDLDVAAQGGPDTASGDAPTVVMLACERLPGRALLTLATTGETGYRLPDVPLLTRAAALTFIPPDSPPAAVLAELDRAEQWADQVAPRPQNRPVLPTATRLHNAVTRGSHLAPHFLTPHGGPPFDGLNRRYLARRAEIVKQAL